MTNRERLTKMNHYDLLCEINRAILGFYPECILETLDTEFDIEAVCSGQCPECISKWLNEEDETMPKTTYETQLALSDHDRLEDKHWSECRQIAHYDDELRRARKLLREAVGQVSGELADRIGEYLRRMMS